MIVLIDNYDSFTYNLVQRLGEIDPAVDLRVVRNDQMTLEEIEAWQPDAPDHFSRSVHARSGRNVERHRDAIWPSVPLLGVCLGHQCIGHALGARSSVPVGSCTARRR